MTIRQICQWIISIWKFRRKNSSTATTECLEKDTTEIFGINRVLSEREALPLLDATVPSTLIPGSFFAYCKLGNSFDEIVAGVSEQAADRQVGEILRNERYLLRSEKKRPWSFKTRRPFRGRTDKITPTFREKLELAEKTVDEIGPAWKQSSGRGKPMDYDIKKLSAIILVKGNLSFEKLASELKNIKYDATLDGSNRSPCSSYIHYVFDCKISAEWLNVALKKLDELSVTEYSKFGENLNKFVADNSSVSCETLEIRKVAMEERLMREIQPFLALTRNATHTVIAIMKSTNRIDPFIPFIPKGSMVLADAEFDVEENYWNSAENSIDFQVKQKKGHIRKPSRKKAHEKIFNIVKKETEIIAVQADKEIGKLGEKYYLSKKPVEPVIFFTITENWLNFNIRYVTDTRERRIIRDKLNRLIWDELEKSKDIKIASENIDVNLTK